MIPKELAQKIRYLQIYTTKAVNDVLAGEYHSVFKGRGMEFDEVREYQPGDEVRTIDWNVTARAGHPFVKRHKEERELTVIFLVVVSASGAFGSVERCKLELILEVSALLMFSALKNNDKVGLCLFCDEVLRYLPPRKGKANVLRFIRELVAARPVARETRIGEALAYLNRVQKRRAVVFLVSDFLGSEWSRELAVASRRHDLTAITVADPRECELDNAGFVLLRDAETGELVELDTGHRRVRERFAELAHARSDEVSRRLRRARVDELAIRNGQEYTSEMHRFFRMRERRLSR